MRSRENYGNVFRDHAQCWLGGLGSWLTVAASGLWQPFNTSEVLGHVLLVGSVSAAPDLEQL